MIDEFKSFSSTQSPKPLITLNTRSLSGIMSERTELSEPKTDLILYLIKTIVFTGSQTRGKPGELKEKEEKTSVLIFVFDPLYKSILKHSVVSRRVLTRLPLNQVKMTLERNETGWYVPGKPLD